MTKSNRRLSMSAVLLLAAKFCEETVCLDGPKKFVLFSLSRVSRPVSLTPCHFLELNLFLSLLIESGQYQDGRFEKLSL